jgi:acyl carrier protein
LISDIEDEFDITIPTVEIVPKNFNSAGAMMALIERLQSEDD